MSPLGRGDPKLKEFYQTIADVIGVFWQFHKERLQIGDIIFAPVGVDNKPFNPEERYQEFIAQREKQHDNGQANDEYSMIGDFRKCVVYSMISSWVDFLKGLGFTTVGGNDRELHISQPSERFLHPYVYNLVTQAEELGKQSAKIRDDNGRYPGVELATSQGFRTGIEFSTHN